MIKIASPYMNEEEINSVLEVMHSGMLAQGKKVRELEAGFAQYCGTEYSDHLD